LDRIKKNVLFVESCHGHISRFDIERLKEIFRENRENVTSIRTLSDENRSPADF